MPEDILTNEREEEASVAPATLKRPTVREFKEIVARHLHNWGVSSVENLCSQQTEALILELAEHFG